MYFFTQSLFQSILPYYCVLCEEKSTLKIDLCESCKLLLCKKEAACEYCGNTIHHHQAFRQCGHCLNNPPHFDRLVFVGNYEAHLQKMIIGLKFNQQLFMSRILGSLLAENILQERFSRPDCILPVPLHFKRQRERGFNQALEIARIVSKQLHLPIDYTLCTRIRATPPQSSIKASARKQNVHHAFKVTRMQPYRHVAIIDDVVTTTNTVNELSKILKLAGVEYIQIWCLARTYFT